MFCSCFSNPIKPFAKAGAVSSYNFTLTSKGLTQRRNSASLTGKLTVEEEPKSLALPGPHPVGSCLGLPTLILYPSSQSPPWPHTSHKGQIPGMSVAAICPLSPHSPTKEIRKLKTKSLLSGSSQSLGQTGHQPQGFQYTPRLALGSNPGLTINSLGGLAPVPGPLCISDS